MISLFIEIALVLVIIVLGCYILDNLIVALIVCFTVCALLSKKPKKKREPKKQHDICDYDPACADFKEKTDG